MSRRSDYAGTLFLCTFGMVVGKRPHSQEYNNNQSIAIKRGMITFALNS